MKEVRDWSAQRKRWLRDVDGAQHLAGDAASVRGIDWWHCRMPPGCFNVDAEGVSPLHLPV